MVRVLILVATDPDNQEEQGECGKHFDTIVVRRCPMRSHHPPPGLLLITTSCRVVAFEVFIAFPLITNYPQQNWCSQSQSSPLEHENCK